MYTFLFALVGTRAVYSVLFSFSHQHQADACKEPRTVILFKKNSIQKLKTKEVSVRLTKNLSLNGLASFSILIQNFFTSLEILTATFLSRCSSSCSIVMVELLIETNISRKTWWYLLYVYEESYVTLLSLFNYQSERPTFTLLSPLVAWSNMPLLALIATFLARFNFHFLSDSKSCKM